MHSSLFIILGVILIIMGVVGLLSGKIMAGSRGLKPNYYSKIESPILYYLFVIIYISIGVFVITKSV
jgi:hypothetical protein